MKRNKYQNHQIVFNILTYILWCVYFVTLLLATIKLLSGIVVHIVHSLEAIYNYLPIDNLWSPLPFLTYLVSICAVSYLWAKMFKASTQLYKTIRSTNKFLENKQVFYSNDLNVYVVKTNKLLAFTSGILRYKIFISEGTINILKKEELDAVILHELYHVRNLDPLKNILNQFMEQSTPWFPYKKQLYQNYVAISELSADTFASENMNSNSSLLKALDKLIDLTNPTSLNIASFLPQIERIPILTGNTTFSFRNNHLLLIFSICIISYFGIALNSYNPAEKCDDFNQCVTSLFSKSHTLKSDTQLSCISD